jgi:inhibitor of KinA sporulation pathway (predicted exonuclease)
VGEFGSFCRPELNPVLSSFCTELTGITQEQVDTAPPFPEVLVAVESWLATLGIGDPSQGLEAFHLATDGPWDVRNFLTLQCCFSRLSLPRWACEWINLRKHAHNFYKISGGVNEMLTKLGMVFEGREHSGIDDTRNIARIAIQLLRDGSSLQLNDGVAGASTSKSRRYENGGRAAAVLPAYQLGAVQVVSPKQTPVPTPLPKPQPAARRVRGRGSRARGAAASTAPPEAAAAAAGAAVGEALALFCDLDGVLADFDGGILKLTGRAVHDLPVSQMWKAVSRCNTPRGFFGSLDWMSDGRELWDAIKHCNPKILTGCPRLVFSFVCVWVGGGGVPHSAPFNRPFLSCHCIDQKGVEIIGCSDALPSFVSDDPHPPTHTHSTRAHVRSSDTAKSARQKRSWCARHLGEHVAVITCMSREKCDYVVTTGGQDDQLWQSPVSILIDDRERARRPWEAAGGLFVLHRNTAETLAALAEIDRAHGLGIFGP